MFNREMKNNYTSNGIPMKKFPAVVGLNEWRGVKTIYTEYFLFLNEKFGFEGPVKILHGVFFRHDLYLGAVINTALVERGELKKKLQNDENLTADQRMIYESRSTELKLKINGCYGYSLCRENNISSPYVVETLKKIKTYTNQRQIDDRLSFLTSARPFLDKHVLVTNKRVHCGEFASTPLIAIGASILGNSKVILLENASFLLRYLDPRLGEACYFDTDSIFLALHHVNLEDNVCTNLKPEFMVEKDNFIDSITRLSGFLVLEKVNTKAEFYGEKMYFLESPTSKSLGLKGIPQNFVSQLYKDPKLLYSERDKSIIYPIIKRKRDSTIVIENQIKKFKKAVIPSKRLFVNNHSFTY